VWKKLGIGCGVLIGLAVLAIVAAIVFLPRLFEFAQQQVAEEQERRKIAAEWKAPNKDAGPAQVFPAAVELYKLDQSDDRASIPELRIDTKGVHAVYSSGPSQVEVFAYPVSKLEAEALMNRVEQIYKQGKKKEGGVRTWTKIDLGESYARIYLSTPKLKQNHYWFTKGWLLVFRTHDSTDREAFVKEFLRAAHQPAGAGGKNP